MSKTFLHWLRLTVLLAGLARAAERPTNVVLRVTGVVDRPLALCLADLDQCNRFARTARDHDGEDAKFEGVELHELLARAGVPLREKLRGPALQLGVLAKAADGYAALFSVAELDPDMNDQVTFVADLRNGEPLPEGQGPLRLIVAGDKRPARWVRQVQELEVVRLSDGQRKKPVPLTGTVSLAAAANLAFVLDELNRQFTNANPGVAVTTVLGASGNLFAQLQRGAPFDAFLAADLDFPKRLAESGAAVPESLFTYARGRLVLWTTRTNLTVTNGLTELRRPEVRRVALANPDTAPYGLAAKTALERQSLWSDVQPKVVIGENIGQTAQFIESGSVDAGLVALSLVAAPRLRDVGRWWLVPAELHAPLAQVAVLTRAGAANQAAKAYLKFLRSDLARVVWGRFGYEPPPDSAP